jgi:regulatory protein
MGGKITLLEVQKGTQERVNVYLDGEFAFGLNALDAVTLRKGQVLSDAEIQSLQSKDSVAKAMDSAVRFLAPRPRSIGEIRQYLNRKGTAPTAIEEVIERLQALNYVNDLEFAHYWVRNREEFKPRGAQALRYELRQKGVPDDIIREVLEDIDMEDSAYRAAQKKSFSFRRLPEDATREKLGSFLARRGFSYDVVQTAIDRIIQEREAEDNPHQPHDEN